MRHIGEKLRLVAVGSLKLPALILDLTEEPRVLNRQRRLRRKSLKKIHNLWRKAAGFTPVNRQGPHDFLLEKEAERQAAIDTQAEIRWGAFLWWRVSCSWRRWAIW